MGRVHRLPPSRYSVETTVSPVTMLPSQSTRIRSHGTARRRRLSPGATQGGFSRNARRASWRCGTASTPSGSSVDLRPADNEYTFYDGPPFATGLPHYGHILAGVIKDIVPRYWTMRGHRIERRFGWDTHGLPVEMEVEKQLGVSGPKQILEFGVDKYNEACRAMVQRSTEDWEEITRRMGRWVDFENDYKTMDTDFMESVWWVFKQLWDKDLIYQDFKVLPYSYGATTPLSNFEANLDYRDIDDPSITVRLAVLAGPRPGPSRRLAPHLDDHPWTLPANLAVAVGETSTTPA